MQAKYIGKDNPIGLINGRAYEVDINKTKYSYSCEATYDYDEDKVIDVTCMYASQTSIKQNWEEV